MSFVYYVLARAKEPSTWAGLSTLLIGFGYHLDPAVGSAIVQAGIAVAGLIAVFLPARKVEPSEPPKP